MLGIVLIGFALAWFFIQPAPPRNIVMATGSQEGAYFQFAKDYADYLRNHGVTLELRPTAGSLQNYQLLQSDPQVDLAIVQGGTAPDDVRGASDIESLASLYFEPVWVFYRGDETYSDLRELRDKRIAIGRAGSGTDSMASLLLGENGYRCFFGCHVCARWRSRRSTATEARSGRRGFFRHLSTFETDSRIDRHGECSFAELRSTCGICPDAIPS